MADPFRSKRLLFRAVESPDDDALFQTIQTEPISYVNSNARLIRPQSRKDAAEYQRYVAENALLGVIICIQPSSPDGKPTSIGCMHLKPPYGENSPHRNSELSIDITEPYQGKGYGTEAIEWALDWAFNCAGLHRIQVRSFEWNYGARRLYEKLGFKHEGTSRELLFHNGRYWDDYQYAVLDREWKQIKSEKEKKKD